MSPHGTPSQVPGMPSPGQTPTGSLPAHPHRGSGWHASTTCNGPQPMLSATLPGYELTTGRHCQGVHPTAWPMQLDPSKCPVGSPYGCPQQPGDIHGRGKWELQGECPRAATLAIVDQHHPCPHPLPAGGHGPPERSPPVGEGGAGPIHGLEASRGILSIDDPVLREAVKRLRSTEAHGT